MASDTETSPNVPATPEDDKGSWPVAGGRVSPDDLVEIDKARVAAGARNRTDFVVKAVFDRVRETLGYDRISDAERASAPSR